VIFIVSRSILELPAF